MLPALFVLSVWTERSLVMRRISPLKRRLTAVILATLALGIGWRWIGQAVLQLLWGGVVAMLALPLMRRLDRRMKPALAATLSMAALSGGVLLALLLLGPPLVRQSKQLAAYLPGLYTSVEQMASQGEQWLKQSGLPVDEGMKTTLFEKGKQALGSAVPALAARLKEWAGSLGRWMLAPVFAFYFLRDRQLIGKWLLSLVPYSRRSMVVRMTREMRRETASYVRGQLLVSAVVGGLTAVGLLFCGVPAWLLLGAVMGVLELIPYIGPFLGGVLVALFALPGGWGRTLWALGVVVLVQQLEGTMLSPQLVSDATRLHPIAVLLLVALGGAAGGILGILLAIPLLLCARAALRVVSQAPVKEME